MATNDSKEEDTTTTVVNRFMESKYDAKTWFCDALLEKARVACENGLEGHSSVHHYITGRVKTRDSLLKKLWKRKAEGKRYKDEDDIENDIVDIVGIRINLYFPNSASAVDDMIHNTFQDVEIRKHPEEDTKEQAQQQHQRLLVTTTSIRYTDIKPPDNMTPYVNKFGGYTAEYYRVKLPKSVPMKGDKGQVFEIQVVSAIAHVWSEVEHGLVYKVLNEAAKEDVRRLLDSLNGLVKTGEVILEQIQQMSAPCISSNPEEPFKNKYEMGARLLKHVPQDFVKSGSISILHKFLLTVNENTPECLSTEIRTLGLSHHASENIIRQRIRERYRPFEPSASVYIVDHMLSKFPEKIQEAEQRARNEASENNDSCMYDCKVALNSLIWLWELFSFPKPGDLSYYITEHFYADTERRRSLNWALEIIMPTNILLDDAPEPGDKEKLRTLWRVFETSDLEVFKFAFKVSKMGVWREFPKDITQLEKMRASL